MRIMGKNYPNNALIVGGVITVVLACMPFVGNIIESLIGTLRGFISSALGQK